MPSEIKMQLDTPQQTSVLGLSPPAVQNNNPFYNAVQIEQTGDRKTAEHIYLDLLNSDFDNPVLMAALGMNYAVAEKNGLAHLLLRNAYDRLPDMLEAFKRLGITPKPNTDKTMADFINIKRSEIQNAIGTCYKHENHIDEARKWFDMAQENIPINPDIQNNLGTLYINEGRPDKAYYHLREALRVDPDHAQAHWNLSLAMLEEGNYTEGWTEYNWGIPAKVRVDRNFTPANVPQLPIWNGEKGARVVVYGEQGIGDEILFSSMLPDLIADCELVVFECHKKLHKLFANSFPTIDIYPTREDEHVTWPCLGDGTPRYAFTHRVAIGSLGKFYRPNIESFPGKPYIQPTPAAELTWNERLAALPPGPKIGISWIGGHKKTRIEVRSLTLEQMLPILKQKGCQFVSLQYTTQEDEIREFERKHGIKIHQFPEAVYSPCYNDTAGLVANLDLVITVCTSVVHLASSMGVPTWVIVPSRPAWRYRLDLDTMPWYGQTTLFRMSPDLIDWTPVIAEVALSLTHLLGEQNEIQVS
jgi:tetratricopeptide (TPR) repeat protein